MELDFTGKVALITGAGNGIGRATALAFAKSGAKVVVVDRDTAGGEATAGVIRQQGGEAHFVAADVTKSAEVRAYVKAALDAYGAIDCFFNNAGIEGKWAHTADYDEDMFDAVIGLTKTAAGEVARQGIRVNAVCPGPVDTRMIHSLEAQLNPADPASVGRRYQSAIPIGRYVTPDEIANTVLFLCSDLASAITGAQYVVDGARTATGGAVTQAMQG